MFKYRVEYQGRTFHTKDLPHVKIGKLPSCTLRFEEDPKVARMHAVITDEQITDLASEHGTFVNDEKIARVTLQPGDVIRVGGATLTVLAGENSQEKVHNFGATRLFQEIQEAKKEAEKNAEKVLSQILGSLDGLSKAIEHHASALDRQNELHAEDLKFMQQLTSQP